MLDWLKRFLDDAFGLVPAPVRSAISWSLQALGGLVGSVTNNVAGAWHQLTANLDAVRAGFAIFGHELTGLLEQIVTHWIPRYAITAWWWVTHPMQFADQLTLYVVHWLERRAWTIGRYLGEFTLALLVHNVRRVAQLAEDIIVAVL